MFGYFSIRHLKIVRIECSNEKTNTSIFRNFAAYNLIVIRMRDH